MELLKKFTCLVACFVVLSSSFMVGYAVDDGIFEPIITRDDLLDMGYVEDENGDLVLFDENNWWDSISLFSSSTKNFPYFNPVKDIPWSTFPDYIKDIVYMDTSDLSKYEGSFNVPFVSAVVVSQTTVQIFVGVNVGWGWLNDSSISLGIWSLPNFSAISSSSCLYRLSWSYSDDSVVADWVEYSPQTFGNKGNLNRMLNYYFNDASVLDIYGYGANGVRYPYVYDAEDDTVRSLSSYSVLYNSSNNNLACNFSFNSRGFASRIFVTSQSSLFPYIYFDSFTPPTEEELLQQEQNNLLDKQNGILDELLEEFRSSGESDLTTLPGEALEDYNKAESDLVDEYNPDDLEDDLDIDFDNSSLEFVWDLVDDFITADNTVFTLFVSILSLGIIALILGR
ncbi:MAG: hypothetical protein IJB74_01315 [Clostridia bacterium]|nr:hypothetical protein [Clostridia bacterium]